MNIAQDISDHLYQIHSFTPTGVEIAVPGGDIELKIAPIDGLITLTESFIISPTKLHTDWSIQQVNTMTSQDVAELSGVLSEFGVEILILGTGEKLTFPTPKQLSPFMAQGVGVEVMDSRAACRTYNLLAAEERKVAAAIML
ncbi:MAG: MTH938/NDUFAF3 family protein [Chromatiales bacterium]|nr:MTH938/NDUFAF3 family protein [Chromatiales bacterium]